MKTMIIDTSTQKLFVCFTENEKEIYRKELIGKNNHSENLLTVIDKGLKQLDLEVKDFSKIIVGIGPGLYTGLRVSLTVAKMFCWSCNIPLYTVSSLDMIASGYFNKQGIYIIKTRAKRDYVYCKVVEVIGNDIHSLIDDCFITNDEFQEIINKYQNNEVIDEENIKISPQLLYKQKLEKDIYLLEPNYLRGGV